ncbi:hypothetical protein VA596_46825 [Amycolatopsis sp., V23-08]|uniref:Uncharacterized protein n=1 Tax=Amycolatopsis heterodermiae TaxID=3110235 RepID=A0ABU5RMU6_9PSEU|nr:hypothetical protein [Amycolatopsis sp., V23-08]MEA5367115.1 hypothetical protein [Amycolatopsis sp., V23-08]
MPTLTRVLGAATAAYSATIIAAPQVLAKPCRLTTVTGSTPAPVRTLIKGIGARDAAIGVAMMAAPPGRVLRTALAARVASDAADALIFGLTLPDKRARRKVAVFAVFWAALCAISAVTR